MKRARYVLVSACLASGCASVAPDASPPTLKSLENRPVPMDANGPVDVERALRLRLGHRLAPELDRVAPPVLRLASGRTVAIDYSGDRPVAAVRVQDLFGTDRHPTVAAGRVPVVLQLLSPANRPVQVTADLPGFWAGTWAEVRKEMAGRYPKHTWPEDPRAAPPPARR